MNPLIYLASYSDLAHIALMSKPLEYNTYELMQWLKQWGNLHYTYHGQYEIAQGLRKQPDFDPWTYIATYPQTKHQFWENDTLNEDLACFSWIVYGSYIGQSQKHIPNHIAKLVLEWSNKNVYILGNSIELPKNLKKVKIQPDDVVIGFKRLLTTYQRVSHLTRLYAIL